MEPSAMAVWLCTATRGGSGANTCSNPASKLRCAGGYIDKALAQLALERLRDAPGEVEVIVGEDCAHTSSRGLDSQAVT